MLQNGLASPTFLLIFCLLLLLLPQKWICRGQSREEIDGDEEIVEECPKAKQEEGDNGHGHGRSTFLWAIDAPWRKAPARLFGTIHVPYDRVWANIPSAVKDAFQLADLIVFELALQKPEIVERLIQCKQLAFGKGTLREHLHPELFHRLKGYMHRLRHRLLRYAYQEHRSRWEARRQMRRLFPSDWEHRRPVWLLFLLFQLGDSPPRNQQKSTAPMLDLFLAQNALDQGKELLSMETAAEQCNPLQSVGPEQIQFAINYTLGYLEWAEKKDGGKRGELTSARMGDEMSSRRGGNVEMSPLDKLVQHYRCGTLGKGMEQAAFGAHRFAQNGFSASPEEDQMARKVDNLLVHDILLRRNERMARRADALLRQQPDRIFFFALGAGHFLGQHSLIHQLHQLGYSVTPIEDVPNNNNGLLHYSNVLNFHRQTSSASSPNDGEGILLFPFNRPSVVKGQNVPPKMGIQLRELFPIPMGSMGNRVIPFQLQIFLSLIAIASSAFCQFCHFL